MFKKSHWLIILVLLSVFSVNAESQQSKPDNQSIEQKTNQPKHNEKISNPQDSNPSNALSLKNANPSSNLQKEAANKTNYRQDDPKKRWRDILSSPVDIFTGIIAIFTILLVIAGGWQVAIARATTRSQLRAYVFVDKVFIANVAIPHPPGFLKGKSEKTPATITRPLEGPLVYLEFKNSGLTPAYDVTIFGHICVKELPLISQLPTQIDSTWTARASIPPGGGTNKHIGIKKPLLKIEVNGLRSVPPTLAIYIYGTIHYKDTFGKKRFTNYRYFHNDLSGILGRHTGMSICDKGNEAN